MADLLARGALVLVLALALLAFAWLLPAPARRTARRATPRDAALVDSPLGDLPGGR